MKYIDEYRQPASVHRVADKIRAATTKPWTIMEMCGGQTHSIARFGLEELLPKEITLAHGPGCPVCVTPIDLIDKALFLARKSGTIFTTFGDMLRVPGSKGDLFSARANGADVRIVYSPLDALQMAIDNPSKEVVFFAVGFETTAPTNAMTIYQAVMKHVTNFSILSSHVLVPPAIEALLDSPDNRVQGFLAAGHVCAITGAEEYLPIAKKYRVPIVITGFEPLDILNGILHCVSQLEANRFDVENQYERIVQREGNQEAIRVMKEVFHVTNRSWRGIGTIAQSGLSLKSKYAAFDAEKKFSIPESHGKESPDCIAGLVLRGVCHPKDCPAFGKACTPNQPLGAPMVSSEGACAAYYKYRRFDYIK